MKIGILGATGATGRNVIEQLGDTEHEVVAFVRHGRQTGFPKEVEVRAVDIFNSASLSGGFVDIDVIISTLGGFPGSFSPCGGITDGYERAIPEIIRAAEFCSVKQLLILGAWFMTDNAASVKPFFTRLGLSLLTNIFEDMEKMRQILLGTDTEVDWTICCAARLNDGEKTDEEFVVEPGDRIEEFKDEPKGISRSDVARFLISAAENKKITLNNHLIAFCTKSE